MNKKNIIVVIGGTLDPIDQFVRLQANSQGGTGLSIVKQLVKSENLEITVLISKMSPYLKQLPERCEKFIFDSVHDLDNKCKHQLESINYDYAIMSGTISDFTPSHLEIDNQLYKIGDIKEIPYGAESVKLHFKKNKKIIKQLKHYSINKDLKVISFRVTKSLDPDVVKNKLRSIQECAAVDYLIHNDLNHINKSEHKTTIYEGFSPIFQGNTKEDLCRNILNLITD